ncbi:MAG: phage-shock protein [Desulfobacteraceae bacterium]|jgi:phage shock protein B|nr:phage-shock protein [Desulfobacteraceae bacterium]
MNVVLILVIIFGCSVLALAIIGGTILMAIKILKGGLSRTGQKAQAEEAKMVQEIYDGLSRMEQRVESLETIILDRKGKDRES